MDRDAGAKAQWSEAGRVDTHGHRNCNCGIISVPGSATSSWNTEPRHEIESGEAQTLRSRLAIRKEKKINMNRKKRIRPELPDSISVESESRILGGVRGGRAYSSSVLRSNVPSRTERAAHLTISKKRVGRAWQSTMALCHRYSRRSRPRGDSTCNREAKNRHMFPPNALITTQQKH